MIWLHPLLLLAWALPASGQSATWVLSLLECAMCVGEIMLHTCAEDEPAALRLVEPRR